MPMIERDPRAASERDHDLLIVGGGIQGAMVERADFGGETSWNSLRIVHGGLRYLQRLDLPRFRESVRERAWLLGAFPELVEPLPCLLPLSGRGLHRPAVLRIALRASDLLDRGSLPAGRVLGPEETLELTPLAGAEGFAGAALWHDATMLDAPRLLIETLRWACHAGATCLNYMEVVGPITDGTRLTGVRALDVASGSELEFRALAVVNCTGAAVEKVARALGGESESLFVPSLAFNVMFEREWPDQPALAAAARRGLGRTYFLRALGGRLLAGTFHAPRSAEHFEPDPREEEVAELIADLNSALPQLRLGVDGVRRVFAGLLPARRPGSVELVGRPVIHDHGRASGPRGLLTVVGVKYTTARAVAERTLRRIYGRRMSSDRHDRRTTRWGEAEDHVRSRPVPAPRISREEFLALRASDRQAADAFLTRVMAEESVLSLDDLIFRRTDWGLEPEEAAALKELLSTDSGLRAPVEPAR
jgi:glycerol-3-phosphate dehydrogenase